MVVRRRTFINKAKVASLNMPGGDIYRWAERQITLAEWGARQALFAKPPTSGAWNHIRTGNLARSVRGTTVGSNQRGVNLRLEATADYARYVHEGTYGPITAGGRPMPVGQSQLGYPAFDYLSRKVGGQQGYPFLIIGLDGMLVRNALRPIGG